MEAPKAPARSPWHPLSLLCPGSSCPLRALVDSSALRPKVHPAPPPAAPWPPPGLRLHLPAAVVCLLQDRWGKRQGGSCKQAQIGDLGSWIFKGRITGGGGQGPTAPWVPGSTGRSVARGRTSQAPQVFVSRVVPGVGTDHTVSQDPELQIVINYPPSACPPTPAPGGSPP